MKIETLEKIIKRVQEITNDNVFPDNEGPLMGEVLEVLNDCLCRLEKLRPQKKPSLFKRTAQFFKGTPK